MGTAEIIIKGLERNDLSWRNIVSEKGDMNEPG
jgi:methylglyoxal synthase